MLLVRKITVFNTIPRFLTAFLPIFFVWYAASAQIAYQKFPQNNQIFQRNDQNEAEVSVKGFLNENGHSSITLKIFQDDNLVYENTLSVAGTMPFEFSPTIRAGKYNYAVKLYLDGNEVKSASKVAVGDVFLIYGQSNALGYGGINEYRPARDPFLRYYVMYDFNNGNGEWLVPFETSQWPGTGLIALELQRMLSEKYNYPIGVIVGAVGGAAIRGLNDRDAQNPANPGTNYGKLITQTNATGLREQIKYLIFRHGESDGFYFGDSEAYPEQFTKLYNYLIADLPNLRRFYNTQANILTEANQKAGFLRDFQRRSKYLYPKISTLSTVGTSGYDGLHYNFGGYQQTSLELSRIIGREVYGNYESPEVYSPDIQKIFWEGNRLVLEFEQGMQMTYPQDLTVNGVVRSMKDYIYIDGRNDVVQSGEGVGNKIYLTLANISNPKFVSYLPSWFADNSSPFYNGVHLKNSYGMRAFSFDNVEIGGQAPQIPTTPVINNPEPKPDNPVVSANIDLTITVTDEMMVKLTWNGNPQTKYRIQKGTGTSASMFEVGTIYGDNYYDTQVEQNAHYFYKVIADTPQAEQSTIKDVWLKCLDSVMVKTLTALNYIGANTSITAMVALNSAKQLTLEANKFIDLTPGFDAVHGSYFSAQIGGCKND